MAKSTNKTLRKTSPRNNASASESLQINFPNESMMLDSEKRLCEYLQRAGYVAESGIQSEEKAETLRKMRREHYMNISSLLNQYRSLHRKYELFKENFIEKTMEEIKTKGIEIPDGAESSIFERLSESLDLLSAVDEKRFKATYEPHIINGRRIEASINALEFGMRILKAESPADYELIKKVYIDGERRPTVRNMLKELDISCSTYYNRLDSAKSLLTKIIFGYASNENELNLMLFYLRQQENDEKEEEDVLD